MLGNIRFINVILIVTCLDRVDRNIIDTLNMIFTLYGNKEAILKHCIIVRTKSSFS